MNIKNYNGEKIIIGADASSVVLEYNGLNKIETTTAGVNITGAIYVNGSEFTGGGEGGSYANADVDAHLNQSDPTTGHILSWNGTDYAWVAQAGSGSSYSDSDAIAAVVASDLDMAGNKVLFGNVYPAVSDLPDASAYHGMFAHVHDTGAAYFAHSGTWVELQNAGGGGGSLPTRTDAAGTATSVANDVIVDLDITGFKSYNLMSITTSAAAWVRIYATNAARSADNSRNELTDPASDAGVIAEVITTGAQTVMISPGAIGYNLEASPTTNIPVKITNKSGSAAAITVTLNILQLEA